MELREAQLYMLAYEAFINKQCVVIVVTTSSAKLTELYFHNWVGSPFLYMPNKLETKCLPMF